MFHLHNTASVTIAAGS